MQTLLPTLFLSALLFTSCSQNSVGEPLKESTVKSVKETLHHNTDKDGKRVSVDGYMDFNGSSEDKGIVTLLFFTQPGGTGNRLLNFNIKRGNGKNEIYIETSSKGKKDGPNAIAYDVDIDKLKFQDNEGTSYPLTQKIKLSGTVNYNKNFEGIYFSTDDIDSPRKKDYVYSFEDVRIDVLK